MKCLAMIPAYNEGKTIYDVIESIRESNPQFDIIVINDGSDDDTYLEAERAGAKVLDLVGNLGIGGAVQTGYLYAYCNNYDIAVQIDGDGQHNPKDLCKLTEAIQKENADMVIGSRFVCKSDYKSGKLRKIGINYFSRLVSRICKQPYYDPTSGYRMVNRKGIKLFMDYYPQDYPEVETIPYAIRNGLKVKEVKVNMIKRQGGKSSITPLKAIYYMIKVTLALIIPPVKER